MKKALHPSVIAHRSLRKAGFIGTPVRVRSRRSSDVPDFLRELDRIQKRTRSSNLMFGAAV
ncbi:hypothetical protein KW799_00580 [Candidatus Parcubacteria bacterium]|nr:hypothetical protein [Candidatus Parcubacteria bacterium]